MKKPGTLLCLALVFLTLSVQAQYHIKYPDAIPLHGEWTFALDLADRGVAGGWYRANITQNNRQDKVTVPHCFSADPRYLFYTGTAWYRKTFAWKPAPGQRVLLHFDAAYYLTQVWLNGQPVGTHEGGYTPFQFDVTDYLQAGENLLAVSVNNNAWKLNTVPAVKDNDDINGSFPAWINYGGLTRPVYLTVEPEVYVENLKIEATPDLAKGTSTLRAQVRVRNASKQAASPKANYQVRLDGKVLSLNWKTKAVSVSAGQTLVLEAETTLTAAQTRLWGLDSPTLYQLQVAVGTDTMATRFGIRKVEVRNAQLLLNGQPLRLGGGNRVIDYPGMGSLEPDWLIEKDFRLMKEAGMEFQRLTHYTPSEYFYDLADQYGMLIITEAGNWQLTPNQLDNDTIRTKFRQQFREMVERDWNHPSVIAYSVGNEYLSEQPAGQRWTKDMIAYARELDPTRLYTFASMRLNTLPKKPEDEASQYVDFVCTNTYGNHARSLDHIHQLYPDKPILISEWGVRADAAAGEAGQAQHISEVMKEIRKRPYVVGAAWWTYNDYQSRYYLTNPNGYRPWGLVGPDRTPRLGYATHQQEMAPLTVEKVGFQPGGQGVHQLRLKVTARNDFPAYPLRGYFLETPQGQVPLPDLQPGQSRELSLSVSGFEKSLLLKVVKPTGFVVLTETLELK
ncbi:beta-glucuronidase [Rhabdobacter roseus]|uniref:Beta-glucuronidase n=1 Tax=Rhabdobacter roseus TaxID=1655419 RepID=A0A840TQG6_9BACT|nr:glycoside hydrolase family 2 TIM barrel-domain containing protein [Rhabdobacter roseus]MBB5286081.1 beta-glucuronidase [Rhabdobacter roseus]